MQHKPGEHNPIQTLERLAEKLGFATPESVEAALEEHRRHATPLLDALLATTGASEAALLEAIANELGVPMQRLRSEEVDTALATRTPAKVATHYLFVPLSAADGTVKVAVRDPTDYQRLDELRARLGCSRLELVVATKADILDTIKAVYGIGAGTLERMLADMPGVDATVAAAEARDDEADEGSDASIIRFVNQIIEEAHSANATDIHIEPFMDRLRVRYRIDGVLTEASVPASIARFYSQIVTRIKVMAALNVAERRLPQDGRISATADGRELDLRVSILPTPHGESVQIRILERNAPLMGLSDLGLSENGQTDLQAAIAKPHGIILLTGPTGSGKTTTLYACLSMLNQPETKIVTLEDPVEYQLEGVTQMQVNAKIGFSFAVGLRSILRHDPNVIMVGEIRDSETAELAVRASLTGHLVFSTLHTNDAPGAVTRLIDIGVEPYLVASSLEMAVAQRLVRLVCPHCKRSHEPTRDELIALGLVEEEASEAAFCTGAGCDQCRHTGYRGRTGIHEIMTATDALRDAIVERRSTSALRRLALSEGMAPLRQDGLAKGREGITTLAEVLRVSQEDSSSA